MATGDSLMEKVHLEGEVGSAKQTLREELPLEWP